MKINNATSKDLADIQRILEASGLPAEDCGPYMANFFIAEEDTRLVGVGGLELMGVDGLVRSIAVMPDYRGRGIGRELYRHIADRAIRLGVRRLYLLTETAERYFSNLGFVPVARNNTPATIAGTRQFRELCPQSATVMFRDIAAVEIKGRTRPMAGEEAPRERK